MMNLKDEKLIAAINSFDRGKIDDLKGNINLADFMIEFSYYISPEALLFLRDNYDVSLRNIFSRIDVTVDQMKFLLRNGYKPSKRMIYQYSGYFDLSLFKTLLDYGIKIPEEVVWKWDVPGFVNALTYYLENKGNPNIRAFALKGKKIGKYKPSLIDKWVWAQDNPYHTADDQEIAKSTVNTLLKYGAKKSPCAMTWQEDAEYHKLKLEDQKLFKEIQKQKIEEIRNQMAAISDEDELMECAIAIERFEKDIKIAELFIQSSEANSLILPPL